MVSEIMSDFFVILDYIFPFYLPNNPKDQNFEKMKNTLEVIIIFHKRT